MPSLGNLVGLTAAEYADLEERVDRFYTACAADGATELEPFLPPPGTRHRPHVLVEMIKTDMGRRVRAGFPIRVETYLTRFPHDLPAGSPPITLLAEEYDLRHKYADRPGVEEYRARFPAAADALARQLRNGTATAPPKPRRAGTIGLDADGHSLGSGKTAEFGGTLPPPAGKTPPAPPTAGAAGDTAEESEVLPADLQYKLGRRLGAGAYGEVYEAIDARGFRVAVKRIHRAVDHPASKGEVAALDAMKALRHPFLLQTQAYWVFRDRLVIVMELADGSLTGLIDRHKDRGRPGVPPEELIPIFEQAAEALDYLHSQNVSHRDVKPDNLLLLKGYTKVADFGLAREHVHQMTMVGGPVGTVHFMAPEVWRGKVSLHSDQYSLGATYVVARLGRPPFPGGELPELCYQHVHEAPNLDPLPPAEQRVLLKAMAKKPEDRYPSCAAFARELRVAVTPAVPRRRAAVWVAVAAALVVGLVVGLAAWFRTPVWCPPNWSVPADTRTETLPDGRVVPKLLTRSVGGERLELVLILPTRPDDPPAFYMLRNKVTNRVFRHEWDRADADPDSRVSRFRNSIARDPDRVEYLLPKRWRGGANGGKGPLGIDGEQAGVPVVGVTAVQAILVAEELGGRLPTKSQWRKAVGANGDDSRPGPAGAKETSAEQLGTGGQKLSFRPLALGLKCNWTSSPKRGPWPGGPWPVAAGTVDESVHGIHQLTSNGLEWADGEDEPQRVNLFAQAWGEHKLLQTGQTWEIPTVLTFDKIARDRQTMSWADTTELAGFRIVLIP